MAHKSLRCGILLFALLAFSPGLGLADIEELSPLKTDTSALDLSAGYRWVNSSGNPNRAAEYSFLENSPTSSLSYRQDVGGGHFSLVEEFVNRNDYSVAGAVNYKALFRMNARSERMYHNLDHIPYEDHAEAREPAGTRLTNVYDHLNDPVHSTPLPDLDLTDATYSDQNPGVNYGRRITIDEVRLRGKFPSYPAHINFSVWRMEKKGKEQLRFVDENCAAACHMQSRTREIDRVTEEITAGFDAHLGPVDIAFLQTLRKYRERNEAPVDSFDTHTLRYTTPPVPRELSHDETPDSQLSETTFMINLPPSGGFVSSASYTIGKRENLSDLPDVSPDTPETDYQKLTADVTYTPGEKWTFSFRYRMLELESDGPARQTSSSIDSLHNPFFFSGILVRESIDLDRDSYTAFVSYRPSYQLTFKGEFEREEISRSNTGLGQHSTFEGISKLNWALSDNEIIDRYRLGFSTRLLQKSALKLNGWYEHRDVGNPAYSTTLSDSNELFFSASYKPSSVWGATGSIDLLSGSNDKQTATQFDNGIPLPFDLERSESRENLAIGLWFFPNDIISADLNYGLLHSRINQDVLFGSDPDPGNPGGPTDYTIADDNATYEQRVHSLSAGINLRVTENLNCRLEAYHIRSRAAFSPGFDARVFEYLSEDFIGEALASSDGLKETSELDLKQNGAKARINWKLSARLTAGFEYTFNDYKEQNSSAFDGTAETFIASLSGTF